MAKSRPMKSADVPAYNSPSETIGTEVSISTVGSFHERVEECIFPHLKWTKIQKRAEVKEGHMGEGQNA